MYDFFEMKTTYVVVNVEKKVVEKHGFQKFLYLF